MNTPTLILMGILNLFGLEKRSETTTLSNPQSWLLQLLGNKSKAGQTVTLYNTMGLPALFGAYRVLSESIASLPIEVYEKKDGGMYPASNLKIRKLLRLAPNQMYSAYDLKVINVLDLMQTGNYFNRIYRKNGEISEIIRLDPSTVTVLKVKGKNEILYEVKSNDLAGQIKTQM